MPQPSPEAIAGARAAQTKTGIPASVSLAQFALESGWGAHAPGNNPFGMKPRKGLNDPQQLLWTTEWSALRRAFVKVQQPFRVFPSIAAAFEAHAELISTAKVYAAAMAALPNVVTFIERMAARYATDPLYSSKLQALIASAGLRRYDA